MYGATQKEHAVDVVEQNPDVYLGDLNSGLNYQKDGFVHLTDNGYSNIIPEDTQTWCPPSHFTFPPCVAAGGFTGPYSAAIDHIMVKKCSGILGYFGRTFNESPLMSDHLGVAATVVKFRFPDSKMAKDLELCQ